LLTARIAIGGDAAINGVQKVMVIVGDDPQHEI